MFEISLQEKKAQPVVFIRAKVQIDMLPKLLEETDEKIKRYLKDIGVKATDTLYTRYHNALPGIDVIDVNEVIDVEIGVPVSTEVQGNSELKSSIVPAGRYVTAMYKGDPDELETAYEGILKWIYEADLKPAGAYFEYYYGEDEETPVEDFVAKIVVPVE
jgi:effector-binding domain-containing protein